jgi:hypothetical protein
MKKYIGLYAFIFLLSGFTLTNLLIAQKNKVKVSLTLPTEEIFLTHYSGISIVERNDAYRDISQADYIAKFQVELERQDVYNKDVVELTLIAERNKIFKGEVARIEYNEPLDTLVIGFDYTENIEGENIHFSLNKQTAPLSNTVPVQVLYEDYKGSFVYNVKKEQGPWGAEYVAYKEYVEVRLKNDQKAVIGRIEEGVPIILQSEKTPYEGMRVRFYD